VQADDGARDVDPVDLLTVARLARLFEQHCGDELTLSQYRTLGSLSGGDERASTLARRLAMPKPTLTALVDGLVDRGYVTRERSPEDRRVVRLSITAEGRAARARADRHLGRLFADLLERCPDPDAVLAALDGLRVALDDRFIERFGGPDHSGTRDDAAAEATASVAR
jgi:DNA-binding MarR family transcriptional regulator